MAAPDDALSAVTITDNKSDIADDRVDDVNRTGTNDVATTPDVKDEPGAKSDDENFFIDVDEFKNDVNVGASGDCRNDAGDRRTLKKDDSGIDIEKSPNRDNSVLSSETESTTQDESGTDVTDSRDFPNQSEEASESSGDDVNNQRADDDVMRASRRRRRISSTESETDDVSTVIITSSESSDEEMETETQGSEPKPRQMFTDLFRRECGFRIRSCPLTFTETISANLSLVQRLELQYKLDQHSGCVNALHFSQNGNLLASGSDDLKVIIWDWSHQKPVLIFDSGHRNNVFQAKFMPYSGDCHVVTCARDGQVRLAELSTTGVCKNTKKLAQHKGATHKLALEMDSPHVFLSSGEDAATIQIDLREDKPNKLVVTKENDVRVPIYSIHSNPCNAFEFCVAGRDKHIRIYDKRQIAQTSTEPTLRKFSPQHMTGMSDSKCNVTCAMFNFDGTEVLGSYNDEDIYLFDTSHSDGADCIKKYHGHRNNATVKGVNFYGPKSEYVISGSDCGNVYIWEKQSEKVVQFFRGDEGGVVNVLEPHPYGPFLATSGLDPDVKIWAPTASSAVEMKDLRSTMKKNRRERRDDRLNEPDMLDGQAIWLLMQHLRRTVRRREPQNEDDSDESQSDSDSNDSDAVADQCNPS